MKTTIRLLAALVCIALLFSISSCATTERVSSDDPFSDQLDTLYAKRLTAQDWLLASAITLGLGVISGTICTTLYNTNQLDQTSALIGIVTSYSVSTIAAGWGTYELFNWNNSFNAYLETLRLQTQYYNTIQWTKKSGQ